MIPFWCLLGSILGGFWASWGRLGASWAVLARLGGVLGPSWSVLGASWGVLAPLGGVLGPSWRRLGLQNTPKINLTRHGTGSAVLFKGSFMQKPCGTTLDRKVSSRSRTLRSLRSLPRCARPAGFHWGFAGVSLAILDRQPPKRSANLPQNPLKIELNTPKNPPQNPPESTPEAEKIEVWRGLRFRLLFVTFCAPPGGVLGPSWGVLGASWGRLGAALGRLGGVLEPSWGVLEPSWASSGRLGASPRF